jgi:GDP-L-fucose synthase
LKKNAKIFVAGGTGLVGSAIIRKLIERGYTNIIANYHSRLPTTNYPLITFFRLDLTNQQQVENFFAEHRPEYIFLAAAKVGGILANNTYKADFIYENMAIALNVIHSAYKYGVKKLLNLGSSCIYPKFAPQPMKEEYLLTGELESTNEPYAIAKISAIKLCRYFNEQYGTNFISAMPTNLYGPNDNFNLETSHVLPALIRKFHLAKLLEQGDFEGIKKDFKRYSIGFGLDNTIDFSDNSTIINALTRIGISSTTHYSPPTTHYSPPTTHCSPPTTHCLQISVSLWGTGEVYREFLYIDDLADACVFLMENVDAWHLSSSHPILSASSLLSLNPCSLHTTNYPLNSPDYFVNVGVGEDIKLKDLAYLVKYIVGFKGEIMHDLSKPDGTPRKLLDVSKLNQLGWKAKISLEEGIRKTYDWYLSV